MTSEPYTYTPVYDFKHVPAPVQPISLSVPQEKMKLFFTRDEYLEMREELDAQKKEKKAKEVKEAKEAKEAKEIKDLCTITNKQDTLTDILEQIDIIEHFNILEQTKDFCTITIKQDTLTIILEHFNILEQIDILEQTKDLCTITIKQYATKDALKDVQ